MFDIVALGELLIDFTPNGFSDSGMHLFEQNAGGAPANMLTACSKFGLKTGFIGKVGADMHGYFLKSTLEKQGIDTTGIVIDPNVFTTLAFVDLLENGERIFSFSRKPGADTQLNEKELNLSLLSNTKIFHFGSLSLTDEPCRLSTKKAIQYAKQHNVLISYDPNYRSSLWKSEKAAKSQIRSHLSYVDILKISDEETELLTDKKDPLLAAYDLIQHGISIVVVTLGSKGALVCTKEGSLTVPGFPSSVVDTTGAGDSFWGGFLSQIIQTNKDILSLSLKELEPCVRFANAVASLCITKHGGIPAIPTQNEVKIFLQK